MKGFLLAGLLGSHVVLSASAQVTPAHPKNFKTRPIGARGASATEILRPEEPPKVRQITYFVLADFRQWTSSDGRPLSGKLIAFEDLVVETPQGSELPSAAVPPEHPTVVAAGKVRLLVNNKPFEVPLERLSQTDRDFVEKLRAAHARKAAVPVPDE
jgi:hypothetical protein